MDKYTSVIMNAMRQNLDLHFADESRDEEIMKMDKAEVFTRVCNWHGFINYGTTIKQWIEDIYKVEL